MVKDGEEEAAVKGRDQTQPFKKPPKSNVIHFASQGRNQLEATGDHQLMISTKATELIKRRCRERLDLEDSSSADEVEEGDNDKTNLEMVCAEPTDGEVVTSVYNLRHDFHLDF